MIIHNTTFAVEQHIFDDFHKWLETVYIKAAMATGIFTSHRIARVLTDEHPEIVSIACELRAESLSECVRWHDETAVLLHANMNELWGEKAMFFTTYLKEI